jgi:hypothetical protein
MIDNDSFIDKKIKEKLMNEINIVPQSIHNIITETGRNITIKRTSKSLLKYVVASLLIFTVGFTTLGITNPTYAQKIPVIGSIFKTLDQMLNPNYYYPQTLYYNYDKYSSVLNISSIYKGYKVTIKEVAYDGISLTMAFTITSKSPIPIKPDGVSMDLEINGENFIHNNSGILTGSLSEDKKTFNGITEAFLTKNNKLPTSYIQTKIHDKTSTNYINIPDKFNLKINIISFYKARNINGVWTHDKFSGNWNFNTLITNEKLKGKIKEIQTVINLDKYEKGFRMNKLIITPLNTTLLGTSPIIFNNQVNFFVSDNYGRELPSKCICLDGISSPYYYMFNYKEIDKDVKSLTFIPYRYKNNLKVFYDQKFTIAINK